MRSYIIRKCGQTLGWRDGGSNLGRGSCEKRNCETLIIHDFVNTPSILTQT